MVTHIQELVFTPGFKTQYILIKSQVLHCNNNHHKIHLLHALDACIQTLIWETGSIY